MAALRFIAAFASRVGGGRTSPFLPLLLRPLFLITEGASPVPEEVRSVLHKLADAPATGYPSRQDRNVHQNGVSYTSNGS